MKTIKKILYIHHGGGQGGAPNSLLYLLKNLDLNLYEPKVACDFNAKYAEEFFNSNGFKPIHIPIARFSHYYSGWWSLYKWRGIKALMKWMLFKYPKAVKERTKILDGTTPNLKHLNV